MPADRWLAGAYEPLAPGRGRAHPCRPADRLSRRVKPCASRRLAAIPPGQGLTRLAGPLRPGRAQPQPQGDSDEQAGPTSKRSTRPGACAARRAACGSLQARAPPRLRRAQPEMVAPLEVGQSVRGRHARRAGRVHWAVRRLAARERGAVRCSATSCAGWCSDAGARRALATAICWCGWRTRAWSSASAGSHSLT